MVLYIILNLLDLFDVIRQCIMDEWLIRKVNENVRLESIKRYYIYKTFSKNKEPSAKRSSSSSYS